MRPRVLIVDDEKEFADSLSERLSLRECDVQTSLSGEDALEKIQHYNVDVVILDVVMPEMGGIEILREIKRRKPWTEVIMLTGQATVETAVEGMQLGALDYVMKPCSTPDLVLKIQKGVERKAEHEERIREAKVKEFISSPQSVLREG
jgi:DNA-binding NtrC family response regulator